MFSFFPQYLEKVGRFYIVDHHIKKIQKEIQTHVHISEGWVKISERNIRMFSISFPSPEDKLPPFFVTNILIVLNITQQTTITSLLQTGNICTP